MNERQMKNWRKETIKVYKGKETGDLKGDVRIALKADAKHKALEKKKGKPEKGMSAYSSSHNSGYDDNYEIKPKGKGTAKDPYRFD